MSKSISLLLLLIAFSITACESTPITVTPQPQSKLPSSQYIVGGGFGVEYKAPVDGTLIWANANNEHFLATKSMKAGEVYEQVVDPTDETVKILLGDDLKNLNLVLYFIPSKSSASESR